RPGVLVRLFDATGAPWDVASRAVESPLPPSWRAKPQLLALPAVTVDGVVRVTPSQYVGRLRTERLSDGVVFVPAAHEKALLVAVVGSSERLGVFDGEPAHFVFTEDERLHVHDVVALPTDVRLGSLKADVRAPASLVAPFPRAGAGPALAQPELVPHRASARARLVVEHLPSLLPVLEAPWDGTSSPYEFALPAGAYRLRSIYAQGSEGSGRGLFRATGGWGTRTFEVISGRRTSVSLDLEDGGVLEITVVFEGPDVGADAFASLELVTDQGQRIPLERTRFFDEEGNRLDRTGWASGDSDTIWTLPPGPARIVGHVWGTARRFDVPVVVRSGSVQRVTVR
ncbi:MAG: hypothetical protein AAFP86_05840, partial [Planctomycetota bacterium]